MKLRKALDRWLSAVSEDDADSPLELAEAAFTAGWNAARPPIKAAADGFTTHNSSTEPGGLLITLHGQTKDGQAVALTITEATGARLRHALDRAGVGLEG